MKLLCLITLMALATGISTSRASDDKPTLSEILARELTATQSKPELNTDEFKDFIKKLTQYKRKKISKADKEKLLTLCEKFDACRYLDRVAADPITYSESADAHKKLRRMSLPQIKKIVAKGEYAKLDDIKIGDLTKAWDKYLTLESFLPIVKANLEPNACRSNELLISLAFRAEDFFPDLEARKTATLLYDRIATCGNRDSALTERSMYRSALIKIWNNQCDQAEKTLLELSSKKESDFSSRSFFWLAKCAENIGKKVAFREYRERLYTANPISYYLLLLQRGELDEWTKIHKSEKDSDAWFRSKTASEINSGIYTTEGLLDIGEKEYARQVLRNLERKSLQAEPQVRLYLAALAHRLNESIMQFKLLDSVFREDHNHISTRTLKMFFPLKQFSVVWEHREKVDPYLVAALIRQESGFNANARSRVGARGLMQLMPGTARLLGNRKGTNSLFDPEVNVKLGVRYFKNLLDRFDGDAELALAGYNAGPHRVEDWLKRYPIADRMLFLEMIPFSETRKYVSLISRNYYWYLSLYGQKDGTAVETVDRAMASLKQKKEP